jgi:Glycosyltransferase family 87
VKALENGSWLSRERVTRVALISAAAGAAMLLFLWFGRSGTVDYFGQPVGSDFTAFWNAGRLANAGEASHAWNHAALNASIQATHGTSYEAAWLYPPVFLLLMALLAAVPYLPALLAWQSFSLAIAGLTLQRILKNRRATLVALASPFTPLVLAHGQNSFLTSGLLGGGLILLEDRPELAGCLLGGLVYKPQLALVLVPLLLLTRSWRALIAAAATAAVLVLVSTMLWGLDSWSAFAASLHMGREYMEQGTAGFYKSPSLFSMARLWGGSVNVGYAAQLVGILMALFLVWRSAGEKANLRAVGVCAAVALSTPYLFDYDMAVVGLGGAFLFAEARDRGFLPFERSALAFIWIAPWLSRPAAQYLALPLGPAAMLVLAWLLWRRVHQGITIPPLTCNVCPVT